VTHDAFDAMLADRVAKARAVLGTKAGEYAQGGDRLHNFRRAAELLRCSPARACAGMMTKHLVSVLDMVADYDAGACPSPEKIDEKVGDAINYLILLEAIFRENRLG
jgi:hypothetical protein